MARETTKAGTPPKKTSSRSRKAGSVVLRPLSALDLDRVVAIDERLSGAPRRGFYGKRLPALEARPDTFIGLAVELRGRLSGFLVAEIIAGEYGGTATVARLDVVGVEPERQGSGLGRTLLEGLEAELRTRGIRDLETQVDWTNHSLMQFLDAAGFELAPRLVLSRDADAPIPF